MKYHKISHLLFRKIFSFHSLRAHMSVQVYENHIGNKPFACSRVSLEKKYVFGLARVHTSTVLSAKTFQDKENEFAHTILTNNASYSRSVLKGHELSKILTKCDDQSPINSPKEVEEFKKVTSIAVSQNLTLEDEKFTILIRDLSQMLPKLRDNEIIKVLHLLCLWPPSPRSYSANYKLIWNRLDGECDKRLTNWNVSEKLLIADYWFCLRLNRISQYNRNLITDLLQNVNELTNAQIIQLMFLINLQRKVPQHFMKHLEEKLESVIKEVSLEEIGIICLGFFKTESKITNFNTIQLIINRFCKEVTTVNRVTAVSILKFLKKSMHLSHVQSYIPLLHRSIQCIKNWDVKAAIHLALLSAECHVYHPLLLNAVVEKVGSDITNALNKDCCKLLQSLAHFNHPPSSHFTSLLMKELNKPYREKEHKNHPRDLIQTALYYAYLGYYNHDLTNQILNPKFIKYCTSVCPETPNSFAELDYCIEIECKNYQGFRVSHEYLRVLNNRRGNMPHDPNYQNVFTNLIKEVLQSLEDILGGNENIMVRHILPHIFSPDIIVRLSKNKKSMPSLYGNIPCESILYPPPNEDWVCFVVTAPFSFAYKSQQITGAVAMKMRQLEKLGYKVIFIPFYEIPISTVLRKSYISDKLKSVQKLCRPELCVKI